MIQSTKQYQQSPINQNEQEFNNDNQNYSIYGDEAQEQNSFNKFKRINDYIENHYHDSNSDDIDMDGNNIGKYSFNLTLRFLTLIIDFKASTIQNRWITQTTATTWILTRRHLAVGLSSLESKECSSLGENCFR